MLRCPRLQPGSFERCCMRTFPDISGHAVKFVMLKIAALWWETRTIINTLGLFLQMTTVIKKLFGILGRKLKPAQTGSVVAHLPVLQATEINLQGLQPQIPFNNFFRLMAVRIQRVLHKCGFCIYNWPKDAGFFITRKLIWISNSALEQERHWFCQLSTEIAWVPPDFPTSFLMSTVTSAVLGKTACSEMQQELPSLPLLHPFPALLGEKSSIHLSHCSLC